jgi:hypothetical protein
MLVTGYHFSTVRGVLPFQYVMSDLSKSAGNFILPSPLICLDLNLFKYGFG